MKPLGSSPEVRFVLVQPPDAQEGHAAVLTATLSESMDLLRSCIAAGSRSTPCGVCAFPCRRLLAAVGRTKRSFQESTLEQGLGFSQGFRV